MDVESALVVHGAGMDEIALHGETTVAEVRGDDVEEYTLVPDDVGLEEASPEDVAGGSPEENARHLRRIFEREETGAKRDIVLANSGAALYVSGIAPSLKEGVEIARDAIEEGHAEEKLHQLVETQ
jgi:anthranilate phosphoribosyltransferase